ncbi:MAG: thiosulfate oxidation carrier complex protein SoxZ [Deinococcales bacterium]
MWCVIRWNQATRKDANGETIAADYIDMMEISFDGEHLATISPKGGVSANPLFGFKMTASKAGDLVIKYTDMAGDSGEKVVALELAS